MADWGGGSRSELIQSIESAADPIRSFTDEGETADLEPIMDAVGQANVIGLGEASHGTREFHQFKRRLVRHRIEEYDLRLLGLEMNFGATLAIDAYITRGVGSAREALCRPGIHDSFKTASILSVLKWLRRYNQGLDAADRVHLHGLDSQHAGPAASRLRSVLDDVAPDAVADSKEAFEHLEAESLPDPTNDESLSRHLEAREAVIATSEAVLDSQHASEVEDDGHDFAVLERLVWSLEQGRRQFQAILDGRASTGANVRIRDSAMAAQVQWLLRYEGLDSIAIWGHNAHLTRGAFGGGTVRHTQGIPSLGKNLALLGSTDYYALGLVVGGGRVGARHVPTGTHRAYQIEPAPDGSVPAVFGAVDQPQFFLDLRSLDSEGPLGRWLDSRPLHYDIVGGYEDSPVELVPTDYRRQFDGLIFVRETSATDALDA